jgi:hypothetical protein
MPAPRTGGLYETCYQQCWADFVEPDPSRKARDGSGTFQIESSHESKEVGLFEILLPNRG